MKKIKLLILSVLLFNVSNAQLRKLEIGFQGGIGFSNNWGHDNIIKPTKLVTPKFGLSLGLPVNRHFELVSNFSYETKGEKYSNVQLTNDYGAEVGLGEVSVKYNYVTANILARGLIGIGNNIKLFVNAGPFAGYLLKVKEISKADRPGYVNGSYYSGSDRDITGNFKKIDYGITTGIGVMYPLLSKIKLSFEVRNSIGLYNISKLPVIHNGTIKTKSLDILAGVCFKL